MKLDKRRYLKQKRTASEKVVILLALGLLCLTGIFPMVQITTPVGVTENPETPNSAWTTLTNTSAAGTGATFFTSATANGTLDFTQGAFSYPTGYSSVQSMPVVSGGGWSIDRMMITISGNSLQDTKNYLSSVGTFVNSGQWQQTHPWVYRNWPDETGGPITNPRLAYPSWNSNPTYSDGDAGSAQINLDGNSKAEDLLAGVEFGTGSGWTATPIYPGSGDTTTNIRTYTAWSQGTASNCGCWNCQCCAQGINMPTGEQSGSSDAYIGDDGWTAATLGTYNGPSFTNGATNGPYGGGSRYWSLTSTVRGKSYAAYSNSDGCGGGTAQAAHKFDLNYVRNRYVQASTSYYNPPTGVMSKTELKYSMRYHVVGLGGSSSRMFDILLKFEYQLPGGGAWAELGTKTVKYTDTDWSTYNNVDMQYTINLATNTLGPEGYYLVRVSVAIQNRQYNAQGPNSGNPAQTTEANWVGDEIRVDLWDVQFNYEALMDYPYNSYTFLETLNYADINLGQRSLFGSDPTLNTRVLVFNRPTGIGEEYGGACIAAFVRRPSDGQILVCPSTTFMNTLCNDAYNTYRTISWSLAGFNAWVNGNTQFKIGVGIFFNTAGFRVSTGAPWSFWIDTIDLSITAHPTASEVDLCFEVWSSGSGYVGKNFTDNGFGGGTVTIDSAYCGGFGPSSGLESFRFTTYSKNVAFSFRSIAFIRYSYNLTQATYTATSTDTVQFRIVTSIPIPKAAGITDPTKNYNSSLMHNLTIPRYTVPGDSQNYWKFDKGIDWQNPGNLMSGYDTDPSTWYVSPTRPLVDPTTYGTYTQILQFHYYAYYNQLLDKASVNWELNFTAPNEIAAATDLKISTRSDFATQSDVFLLGETCYLRATYRQDAENAGEGNPTNYERMTAVLLQNYGAIWAVSDGSDNLGAGGTTYNANSSNGFPINQGKGQGYAAICTYNMSQIQVTMPGVYRVGYRVNIFKVVRRTEVYNPVITPPIYDTNNVSQNGTPIEISLTYRDEQTKWPINDTDGVPVTAKIIIDYWDAEAGFGYKIHQPESRFTPTSPVGWFNLTLQYNGNGRYACYPLPRSEWRTGAAEGNITQGFKNFTITLSKDGYQDQVIKGNFSIIVDAYMMFSLPSVHELYTDFSPYQPHYMSTGANAGEEFSLYCSLYERTPDEIDATADHSISDKDTNFYQGHINITYQIAKISDLMGGNEEYIVNDFVNWSFVAAPGGFNYANGSFNSTGAESYRVKMKTPLYRENSVGYGDGYAGGGDERILWYNSSFTVATNTTMVLYNAENDWYFREFQPNIVRNRTNENYTSAGYDAGTPGFQAFRTGKINEEVQIIYLHKENTANITILTLVLNNASDCGYAFNMTSRAQQLPTLVETTSPTMGKYQIEQYWKNETEYSWQGLPLVYQPYGQYGVEYKYMNRSDVIRFRVMHNATYTKMQSQNPYVPPCGPLNGSASFGWDGDTKMQLYGWNSTVLNLTEDTNYLWNWSFMGYPDVAPPAGPDYYNVYGTTWVTPWLNITEHAAVTYTDEGLMPFIIARKKGFNDGKLILNLTILAQATNVTINTNVETVEISRSQSENLGNYATLKVPVGTVRSFNITYRDVTNALYQQWASNNTYMVSGATLFIESMTDDNTFSHIYYNNATFNCWWYYEYSTAPGKYNVTLLVPQGLDMDLMGSDLNLTRFIRFKLYKDNYQPKYIDMELNVTRRAIQLNLVWGRTVAPFSSNELYSLNDMGEFRLLVLSYAIYDLDYGQYVDLDDTGYSPTYINGKWDYQSAFIQDAFWSSKIYSAEEALFNGHSVYNITLWPTSINPAVNVIGTRDVQTIVSQAGAGLKNLGQASHNQSITIVPPATEFRLLTVNNTAIEYFASELTWNRLYMVSFTFQLVDLNHTALKGTDVTWPQVSFSSNCNSTWNNPWFFNDIGNPFNLDTDMTNVINGYMRDYTIIFDIQNITVGAYSVQLNLTKVNFPAVSVNLTFTITPVQTRFESLTINNGHYITSGAVNEYFTPLDIKEVPWGEFLNITFDWRATTVGRQMSIRNGSSTTANKTVFSTDYPTAYVLWVPTQQDPYNQGIYTIKLRTDLPITEAQLTAGYNMLFTIQVNKLNFQATTFSFNITIRETNTMISVFSGSNRATELTSDEQSILWNKDFRVYFEYFAYEHPDPVLDIFMAKKQSLNSFDINGTGASEQNVWQLPDSTLVGEMGVTSTQDIFGGQWHYFYLVSLNTTILNVTSFPDGLPIFFVMNLTRYKTNTQRLVLTILPRNLQIAMSTNSIEGSYIGSDQENFTLYVTLFYEDVDTPGFKVYLQEDLFTISWQLATFNRDTLTHDIIEGEGNSGTLSWNEELKCYSSFIKKTEQMEGSRYILFSITCKNGNFKDTISIEGIDFAVKEEIILWWPILLACILLGIVAVYTIRKAAQLRIPLVLRLIDETITKINADKYPAETGVLAGRNEFMVNTLLDRLEQVGIQWEKAEKYTIEETKGGVEEKAQPPMNLQEINKALDSIPELTVEEKAIFADELKRLARKEQDEFIASLKHQSS